MSENINRSELKENIFFYVFLIISLIGLFFTPLLIMLTNIFVDYDFLHRSNAIRDLFYLYLISLAIGLATIIISKIYMEKDDRLFITLIIGIITLVFGTITAIAASGYIQV